MPFCKYSFNFYKISCKSKKYILKRSDTFSRDSVQYLMQGDRKNYFSSSSSYSILYYSCGKVFIEHYVDRQGFYAPKVQKQSITCLGRYLTKSVKSIVFPYFLCMICSFADQVN